MKNFITTQTDKSLEEMLNDCSIDAIVAIDTDRKIIAWNTMAEKIHGKNKHAVTGKPLLDVIPSMNEDEETLSAISLALKGIKSFVPASKKYYHRLHAENHFIPLKEAGNTVIGVMNLVHEVSHRIKAEEQLQHLNEELNRRLRQLKITSDELASFTYLTSNKIKDPIRQIYTGIEHLIKTEARQLSDGGKATFRRMQSSINRMDLLLDDILNISQISILQKTDILVDLDELVAEAATSIKVKADKPVNFVVEQLGTIKGHRNYLQLLFYNLFDNAAKFNERNEAVIKVSCENVFLTDNRYESFADLEYHKLTIEDNGIGVDDSNQDIIFAMFEKLHEKKYKGSGVGLAIARKIMNAHNGFIEVNSKPGEGSSFNCYFPVEH